MVHLISITTLVALAVVVLGTPTPRAMKVHEKRDSTPKGFTAAGVARPTTVLDLRIALAPKNIAGLEKALLSVSTPGSESYGQYLSLEEMQAFTSPPVESVAAVTAWLSEHDVTDVKVTGASNEWLTFSVPVGKANTLFAADFQTFVDLQTGAKITRTLEYSIPNELEGVISLVHPMVSFAKTTFGPTGPIVSIPMIEERALTAPASCASVITPACLQAMYGIPTTSAASVTTNKLGVTGFIGQYANTADLRRFLTLLRTDINASTTFTVQSVDGGINPQTLSLAGIEADLDIQYTIGIATGVPVTFITVGSDNSDGLSGFLDVFDVLTAQTSPPQVISTSYGFDETDLTSAELTQMCNGYMALGSRGISILFASGDGGVAGGQSQSCTTFIPAFPGSCPWATAVGGTTGINPEIAVDFSSGGFSRFFARPSYQDAAVSEFLSDFGATYSGLFNASNRGFPDIAAIGNLVEINWRNQFGLIGGTSASCPIFASVISLINARLIAAGKPVMGFLNPFIYSNPSAFFDITSGSNPGCGTDGFPAVSGWDPVTGFGSPNFAALLTAVGL